MIYVAEHPIYGNVHLFGKNDFISKSVLTGGVWEGEVAEHFSQHYVPGTDFIDIGANLGLMSLYLLKKHGGGSGHLFECNPLVAHLCAENMRDYPEVYVHTAAIGECHSIASLPLLNYDTNVNIGGTGINRLDDIKKIMVPVIPLDDVNFTNKISVIKIDVECTERHVLDGMKKTIADHKPVLIIEILGGHAYESADNEQKKYISDMIQYVVDMGYDVKRIYICDYLFTPKNN